MARHTLTYTVPNDEACKRDIGKVFVITEMSSLRAERWAAKVFLALAKSNVELPDGFERLGLAGIAQMGIRMLSGLRWEDAEPLLAEMMSCVQHMPTPSQPNIVRPLMDDDLNSDIDEVMTRVKLRVEIWNLHTGFLKAAALLKSKEAAAAKASDSPNT